MKLLNRTLLWVILFSLAMGYLETMVVVYLREIYYPGGFSFPLTGMPPRAVWMEISREAATLLMLVGIGVLAGKGRLQRLAFFLITFAVWDLAYYLFLKCWLDWPPSWMSWDILFLIPIPWVGPVLAPCLIAATMLALGLILLRVQQDLAGFRPAAWEWVAWILGSLLTILACCLEFLQHNNFSLNAPGTRSFLPRNFPWGLFGLGFLLIWAGIARMIYRYRRTKTQVPGPN